MRPTEVILKQLLFSFLSVLLFSNIKKYIFSGFMVCNSYPNFAMLFDKTIPQ